MYVLIRVITCYKRVDCAYGQGIVVAVAVVAKFEERV